MLNFRLNQRGQSVFEYAVILGIVGMALAAMQVYLQRGIQMGIKIAADELALQEGSIEQNPQQALNFDSSTVKLTRTHSLAERHVVQDEAISNGAYQVNVDENSDTTLLNEPQRTWNVWEER